MHVENPLALVGFHDITSHLWANNQIIVPHLIYLINLLIRCGTIRSISTYDLFDDIESNLET